jgi:hypothetical protein
MDEFNKTTMEALLKIENHMIVSGSSQPIVSIFADAEPPWKALITGVSSFQN